MNDESDMMGQYEMEYIQKARPEGYYDLIELPNGRHIPAPIAERLVGKAIIERILSSRAVQRFLSGEPRLLERMMKGWERARKCTDRSGPKDPSSRSPG